MALAGNYLAALKDDGTLWRWGGAGEFATSCSLPPIRLGIHQDWVALTATWDGILTLAADGSLWLWRANDNNSVALLEPSEKPVALGTVFAAQYRAAYLRGGALVRLKPALVAPAGRMSSRVFSG